MLTGEVNSPDFNKNIRIYLTTFNLIKTYSDLTLTYVRDSRKATNNNTPV